MLQTPNRHSDIVALSIETKHHEIDVNYKTIPKIPALPYLTAEELSVINSINDPEFKTLLKLLISIEKSN